MNELLKVIDDASHIVLIAHVNPDADSMGSVLAMYTHLLRLEKKVSIYCKTEKMNPALSFLPFFAKVKATLPSSYDLAMSFDCGSAYRLGLEVASELINFDHHISNDNYGTYNVIDTSAISTTQVLYDFFKRNGVKINAKMATALFAGLIDDSECFTTAKTDARTMHMGSDLIECGADNALVVQKLFKSRSLASIRLKAMILASTTLYRNAKVASSLVQKEFFEKSGAYEVDCEEALHETLELASVEIAIMLRYTKDGRVKGSLRTKGRLDMNELASRFNGGGHQHSAGFVCEAESLEAVEAEIIKILGEKEI